MSDLAWALEEYLELAGRGEAPAVSEWIARYPDIAEELEAALAALNFLHRGDEPSFGQTLGDFQLVREIARGGMGVVYEATQSTLDRRVALKVLPFAAVLDSRQLQRFRIESQAAAHLHHANIVPVFAVGQERGVHYYAMQYVDGRSLAELTSDLREGSSSTLSPTGSHTDRSFARNVARIGADVAAALDYAHGEGVVHRDIKPGNLLVDAQTKVWITDFGLARGRADQSLTMTGDLIGTLRYMSPEQTRGQPADARSDVYSLGATLYEVLALQPAFPGEDAQRVLAEIGSRDPQPLQSLNPSVPEELDTILAKAMAKEPTERYATAGELAEDLRRFLENRPIIARRANLTDRLAKWARRNRRVTTAAVAALVLVTVVLAVSTVLVLREQSRAEDALGDSRENFARAVAAVEAMLVEISVDELADVPRMAEVRERLLQKALAAYESLLAENPEDASLAVNAGRAYRRAGELYMGMFRLDDALAATRRGRAIIEKTSATLPSRRELAHLLDIESFIWEMQDDDVARALPAKITVRNSWQAIHDESTTIEDQAALSFAHEGVGRALANGERQQEALIELRRAVELQDDVIARAPTEEHLRQLASCLSYLGAVAEDAEAELAFRRILALVREERLPRKDMVGAAWRMGPLLYRTGRVTEAIELLRPAIETQAKVVVEFPSVPFGHHLLASLMNRLGFFLKNEESGAWIEKAIGVQQGLIHRFEEQLSESDRRRIQLRLALYYRNLGSWHLLSDRPDDAHAEFVRSEEILAPFQPAGGAPRLFVHALLCARSGDVADSRRALKEAERTLTDINRTWLVETLRQEILARLSTAQQR